VKQCINIIDFMNQRDTRILGGRRLNGHDFRKLGSHISNAKSAYDSSEKRLDMMVDRVKNVIEIGESTAEEEVPKIDTPPVV